MNDLLEFSKNEINPVHVCNSLFIAIVLYLHHGSYTTDYLHDIVGNNVRPLLGYFAVGGFFFFSGCKLALSHTRTPYVDFLKNRLKRIYLLYLFALIVFSFTAYPFMNNGVSPSIENFMVHALCLQTIFPDVYQKNYHTLWFVSALFFCYGYFLLMRRFIAAKRLHAFIAYTVAAIGSVFIIYRLSLQWPVRIFSDELVIFPFFFAAGMLFSSYSFGSVKIKKLIFVAVSMTISLFALKTFVTVNEWYEFWGEVMIAVTSNVALFIILLVMIKKHGVSKRLVPFISAFSYASYCIFLFHRSIWSMMANFWRGGGYAQWFYIVIVGTFLIFLFSYVVQRFFDKLMFSPKLEKLAP